jgi:glycerol-3-phosphate dehydrogenase
LTSREFDVLVVGGGIYGLTIAYDAAQRGLAVALVERDDFGAATSFNHLKTIHGGLRYLQTGDLPRMRESVRERRALARIAPRFLAPLQFVMPTEASLTRNPLALRCAFLLDGLVARDRNNGVDPGRHLRAGKIIIGHECRELFEGAIPNVTSAAMWHDLLTTNGERLTLSFAKAAAKHGAVLANYLEAMSPLRRPLRVRDRLAGRVFEIRARALVNAAGPWSAALADAGGVSGGWELLKVMNLVTSRPARKAALVAATRRRRALVMLPWQGRTLVGTGESPSPRSPDDQDATRSEVDAFLIEVNETFPGLGLQADEITLVHRGIVPAGIKKGTSTLLGRSRILEHPDASRKLISVVGVKYTTARSVAERVVDLILKTLGRAPVRCSTAETLLPDASLDDRDPADPVRHAIRDEMAVTLNDVVIRRTGLGAAGYPGDALAHDVANRMQAELGWPDERKTNELALLKRFYEIK